MNKKFELFGGCLGNGITLCNKAVYENGDYKVIGHISEYGRIKFYVADPVNYIPDEAMKTICRWSEENEKKFKERWFKLPDIKRYEILLDEIPYTALLESPIKETLKACTDLREKVVLLEQIYFKNYA
ncbi:MAG: hypothetical protein IJL07_10380 [Lachnospiraceae bacterium]|nr:hypothetical protein [Lachnospiraceae bacterium]